MFSFPGIISMNMVDARTFRLVAIPMPRHYDLKIMVTEINNGNRYWKFMTVLYNNFLHSKTEAGVFANRFFSFRLTQISNERSKPHM
jgi:hypothetical protein